MNAPNQISFLPEDYLERKAQRRANVICAVLALIVMAAIGSAFTITERVTRKRELVHADVERRYSEAAKQIAQVEQVEQKQQTMARQAELAASLLEKTPRSLILAEVTNAAVPAKVVLSDFTLTSVRRITQRVKAPPPPANGAAPETTDGPTTLPPAQPIIYDVTLHVGGTAGNDVQVADFIHRLSNSALFKDVNLVISDEVVVDEIKMRKFQVEMSLAT